MADSQELKNLKAELEAATAELDRLTKQASGLPTIERVAVEAVHAAKKAHARGEVEKAAVLEARKELHDVRDLKDDLKYEIPEAKRGVLIAQVAVEKRTEREANELVSDAWALVDAERAALEAAQQAEAEAVNRATRLEGIVGRAQRNAADARRSLAELEREDKALKQQEALDAGLEPRARPASRGHEIVFDSLR